MFLIIHSKYKYFDSTEQTDEDRQQKFHFCRLPVALNVMLNLSISYHGSLEEHLGMKEMLWLNKVLHYITVQ